MSNYFEDMEKELMSAQEEKQESLGLKKPESKRKVDLHVTIPQASLERLKAEAKKKNLSVSVMIQLLIDGNC